MRTQSIVTLYTGKMKRELFLIFGIFCQFFVTQACEVKVHPDINATSVKVDFNPKTKGCPDIVLPTNFTIKLLKGNDIVESRNEVIGQTLEVEFTELNPCTEYTVKIWATSNDKLRGTKK